MKHPPYPYTDAQGVLHMSHRVEIDFNLDSIRRELNNKEWEEDKYNNRSIRSCYLGSWLALSPSGKFYMPWAHSNVDGCPVCNGTGVVPSPRKQRLRKKYRNKARKLRTWLLRFHGSYCGGTWPEHLQQRLKRWDAHSRENFSCPRCQGLGSAEACDDELFQEGLDLFLEKEPDLFIEQDSGDIFVVQTRDKPEEEETDDE